MEDISLSTLCFLALKIKQITVRITTVARKAMNTPIAAPMMMVRLLLVGGGKVFTGIVISLVTRVVGVEKEGSTVGVWRVVVPRGESNNTSIIVCI